MESSEIDVLSDVQNVKIAKMKWIFHIENGEDRKPNRVGKTKKIFYELGQSVSKLWSCQSRWKYGKNL